MGKLSIGDTHILDICCQIEESCSKLYRYFSELYAENPQVSALWEKTSQEEDSHAAQFRLAYNLQGAGIQSLKTDLKRATALLAKIHAVYEGVQKTPPPLTDALRFAVRLEHFMADYHMNALATYTDESLARLFTSMMNNDYEHIGVLEKASEGTYQSK